MPDARVIDGSWYADRSVGKHTLSRRDARIVRVVYLAACPREALLFASVVMVLCLTAARV